VRKSLEARRFDRRAIGRGNGHRSIVNDPDGGGFTASEWRDACDENEDFEHDYFSGAYDRPCPSCAGKGRVQVIDTERVTSWRDKIVLKEFKRQERDSAEIDAMHEAERRMGA
jgi:hypothetical protein